MKKYFLIGLLILIPSCVWAANMAVTQTHSKTNPVQKYSFDFLSDDAAGTASASTTRLNGVIGRVCFESDAGGTQPDDNWDVTLTDDTGFDILVGAGANVDRSATQCIVPMIQDSDGTNQSVVLIDDIIDLAVSNAGNAKGGIVHIYFR